MRIDSTEVVSPVVQFSVRDNDKNKNRSDIELTIGMVVVCCCNRTLWLCFYATISRFQCKFLQFKKVSDIPLWRESALEIYRYFF